MTETAGDVITDALQEIVVRAAEAPLQSAEFKTGITYLNNMMAALSIDGINLGFTEIVSVEDPMTVPLGTLEGIKSLLAIKLAPQFDGFISPALVDKANDGLRTLEMAAMSIIPTSYGPTVPIGSGNEGDARGTRYRHFYPPLSKGLLNERGGFISVETDTPLDGDENA